jgi:hypothetical protein
VEAEAGISFSNPVAPVCGKTTNEGLHRLPPARGNEHIADGHLFRT